MTAGTDCNSVMQDTDPYSSATNAGTWNSWTDVAKTTANGEAFLLLRHTCLHHSSKGYCNDLTNAASDGSK
jgi:hypothetical protein